MAKGSSCANQQLPPCEGLIWGLYLQPASSTPSLTHTHTHLINTRAVRHVPRLIYGNVLTSTMESTSSLPYQSGSYMSARHACTFLDDSCMADDTHRHIIRVQLWMEHLLDSTFSYSCALVSVVFACVYVCETPFTASRYALRSLCSLLPSVYG